MSRSSNSDSGIGCLVVFLLVLIAMPIVGLFLLFSKNNDDKATGLILLIAGTIIWLYIALH